MIDRPPPPSPDLEPRTMRDGNSGGPERWSLTALARAGVGLAAIPLTVLNGVLAVGLMASAILVAKQDGTLTPLHVFMIAAISLPVVVRLRFPIGVTWVVAAAIFLNLGLGFRDSFFETFAALLTAYTAFAYGRWGALLAVTWAIWWVGLPVALALEWQHQGHVDLSDIPYNVLLLALVTIAGYSVRTRRANIRQAEERAGLVAREAASRERNRIARDLHDIVAHSLTVMVLQATSARRLARRDPVGAAATFDVIEETGRQALADLRRAIGLLDPEHGGSAPLAPTPTLDQLAELVEAVKRSGVQVDLSIEGAAHHLSPALELTVYRIVQEALTNVLKHAGADSVHVRILYGTRELTVEVLDNGRGNGVLTRASGGNGLVGMRERVRLHGGELLASTAPTGGFQVVATLPLESAG